MKTFFKWCEEHEKELPVMVDADEAEAATGENTKRTGITYNYPDAYVRAHYPHKYFNPTKATTDLDLEQKPKRVPDSKGMPN